MQGVINFFQLYFEENQVPLYDMWQDFLYDHQLVIEIITVVFIIVAPFFVIWFATSLLTYLMNYILKRRSNFMNIVASLIVADILVIGFFIFVTEGVEPVVIALPSLLFMPLILSIRLYFANKE